MSVLPCYRVNVCMLTSCWCHKQCWVHESQLVVSEINELGWVDLNHTKLLQQQLCCAPPAVMTLYIQLYSHPSDVEK
jgi:hypothetical protein